MNAVGLRELDGIASKLEATIQKLPQVKRGELLPEIERIRTQLKALLSALNAAKQPLPKLEVRTESVVWTRKFEAPILLPEGKKILTLREAAHYIIDLPPETVCLPAWKLAMEALSQVTERSPTTLARRAFLNALNRTLEGPSPFRDARKDRPGG